MRESLKTYPLYIHVKQTDQPPHPQNKKKYKNLTKDCYDLDINERFKGA